jgi:hypothetical protein
MGCDPPLHLAHLPGPAGRSRNGFGVSIFDMDGLITDTARAPGGETESIRQGPSDDRG